MIFKQFFFVMRQVQKNALAQIELQKNMMPLFCMVPSECVPCMDASWRLPTTTMLILT
jgi:hypothetical protein